MDWRRVGACVLMVLSAGAARGAVQVRVEPVGGAHRIFVQGQDPVSVRLMVSGARPAHPWRAEVTAEDLFGDKLQTHWAAAIPVG